LRGCCGSSKCFTVNNTTVVGGRNHTPKADREKTDDDALREPIESYQVVFNIAPIGMWLTELDGSILAINRAMLDMTGYTLEELKKAGVVGVYADAGGRERLLKALRETGRVRDWEAVLKRRDGTEYTALMNADEVEMADRRVIFTAARDITEIKRAEKALKERDETIVKLSTPLIELWEGIMLVPLVGILDSARVKQLNELVLRHVAGGKTEVIVMDISGIAAIDTKTANYILRTIQAVRLMGSDIIITGIRPDVAVTLVTLGVELSGIVTRATLREGLEYAFERLRLRLTRG
jgi:rsbT co-antagonist protein RsbR